MSSPETHFEKYRMFKADAENERGFLGNVYRNSK
jgi:hypothetical protein